MTLFPPSHPSELRVVSTLRRVFVYLSVLAAVTCGCMAQGPDGFNPTTNGAVVSLAVQSDGKVLIGGNFNSVGGVPRNRIARLNADGSLDSAFDPNANNYVWSISVQPDGKILMGGGFTDVGGVALNYFARLNADGSVDSTFFPEPNASIYSSAIQPDGKILLAGFFTTVAGVPRNYVARLNPDGTLDGAFNPETNAYVSSFALQPDGKILISGGFTTVGSVARNHLARLNADGSLDAAFNPNVNAPVYSLAVQNDGKIFIGGGFSMVGGVSRNHFARLNNDGSLDSGFNINANGSIVSLSILAGGKVLISGEFTTIGGVVRNRIARLNAAGSLDTTFHPDANGVVYFGTAQADGKVLMGGEFTTVGGVARPFLARLANNDVAAQSIVVTNTAQIDWLRGGSTCEIEQVTFESWDGSAWILQGNAQRISGGWRLTGLSLPVTSLVRARGRSNSGFQNGSTGVIEQIATYGAGTFPDIAVATDGGPSFASGTATLNFGNSPKGITSPLKTITVTNVGNAFLTNFAITTVGGDAADFTTSPLVANALAPGDSLTFTVAFSPGEIGLRGTYLSLASNDADENPFTIALSGTGTFIDPSFDAAMDGTVKAMAVQADGRILVGGDFTSVNGIARNSIARLISSGSLDPSFNPNADAPIDTLAVQADGKILIGGNFTTVSGLARSRIARLNTDGSLDLTFSPTADGPIISLTTQADGKILIGGEFSLISGAARGALARLNNDGSLDATFSPAADAAVRSISVQADGKILVGGNFTTLAGAQRHSIARLNADGSLDSTFAPDVDISVRAIALQADGASIIAGDFTTVNGVLRNRIARLNIDGTLDIDYNPNANSTIASIVILADGKAIVGGYFTNLCGASRSYLARLLPDGTLDLSFTPTANGAIAALAVFSDGNVLIGGPFTSVDGLPRRSLAKLSNTIAATQAFAITGPNRIDWLRAGSTSELAQVTFESWNGSAWIPLASPTRISGGWSASGLSLTANTSLRAQGKTTGGSNNNSGGIIEQTVIYASGNLPDLTVSVNGGPSLVSASAIVDLGSVPQNISSATKTITLTNSGTAPLTNLSLTKGGANFAEFTASILTQTTLAPGASTSFTVSFKPSQSGPHGASLAIASNDADESPFTLALAGTCTFIDPTYNPNANGVVSAMALQADGKVLLGGGFTTLSGQVRQSLARLNPDSSLDSSFAPTSNGHVHSITVQADGRILVGGLFTTISGVARNSLARLNPDGNLDPSFNPDVNASVRSILIQSDGKILLAGDFTSVSGISRNRLARLNLDGSLDTSFQPDANGTVETIARHSNGGILIGGSFTSIGGVTRNRIALLAPNGDLDLTFDPNITGTILTLAIQNDGKILLGGNFTHAAGIARQRLARLNSDGSLDALFNPAADGPVASLVLQADGKILVGGEFTTLGQVARSYLARLLPDGRLDLSFAPQPSAGVHSLAILADGKILLGGKFTSLDGLARSRIAQISNTTAAVQTLTVPMPNQIDWLRTGSTAELEQVTFDLWNGSAWTSLTSPTRIAGGWRSTGLTLPASTWLRARGRTTGGVNSGSSGIIEQISAYGSGTFPDLLVKLDGAPILTASAIFSEQAINTQSTPKIISLTNAGDAPLSNLSLAITGLHPADFTVTDLGVTTLAPGATTTVSLGFSPSGIGPRSGSLVLTSNDADESPFTLTLSGTGTFADPTFNLNANGIITAFASQADGKTLIGGTFTQLGGVPRNGLARIAPDGSLDASFIPVMNGSIASIVAQPDGKILVGGSFSIAQLNTDGSLDLAFDPSVNGPVNTIAIRPDGKILLGGAFTTVAGVARSSIARLNPDGSLDISFNPTANAAVRSLAVQPDGKILVGGSFTSIAGGNRDYLARLNADGSLDTGFNPSANGLVNVLMTQPDGKILIAGNFITLGGITRNRIARVLPDGSLDTSFHPDSNNPVLSLALQADGKILVAGEFTTLGGVTRNRIAMLNPDGSVHPPFDPAANGLVYALALQADGKILAGGEFTTLGGVSRNRIARIPSVSAATSSLTVIGTSEVTWLRSGSSAEIEQATFESWNGSTWTALGNASRIVGGWQMSGLSLPTSTWLRATGRSSGGYQNGSSGIIQQITTYGGGTFPDIAVSLDGGPPLRSGIAPVGFLNQPKDLSSPLKTLTLTNTGNALLTSLSIAKTGLNSADFTLGPLGITTLAPGASVDISISFTPTSIGPRQATITLASNDADESPFTLALAGNGTFADPTFTAATNGVVYSLAAQADGKTLVGGDFTQINGQPRNRLARLHADGSLDASFNPDLNAAVYSIALQPEGGILIGGFFTTVSGVSRNYLARLNPDGSLDPAFHPNPNSFITTLAVQADGRILIGGYFITMANEPRNSIARLHPNGSLDASFNPNANGAVTSLALQAGGKILIGGDFTTIVGVTRNRIARLNANGSLDTTFNPNANAYVSTIAVQADGKILIGGGFTLVRGVARNRIARLNASGTLDSTFNPNASAVVHTLALQTDGKILLGGEFTLIGGISRNRIAMLSASGNLDPSFDPNANGTVHALTIQADGKIQAAGGFSSLGGVSRHDLARLPNAPATQTLTVTGTSQIEWLRGGATSELEQVTFDSWNGSAWITQGDASRIPNGWQKSRLALPTSGWIRARGKIIGGSNNGTSGIIEQVISYGAGSLPDIAVSLENGPVLTSGSSSVEFTGQPKGVSSTAKVFTLTNTGTAPLTHLSLTKNGAHPSDFALSTLATTTLAPAASIDFTVIFTPSEIGPRSINLAILSNDADESPFNITLSSTGFDSPEIQLNQPVGTDYPSGSSYSFGLSTLNISRAKIFTIYNTGLATLDLGLPSITGANFTDFSFTATATSVPPNGQATLLVIFTPTSPGAKNAILNLPNNDSDEASFTLNLTGSGNSPPTFSGASFSTPYQTPISIPLGTILANATDPDGHNLSITAAGPGSAQAGSAVLQSTAILYTPASGFSGPDTFILTITDSLGAFVNGTVTLTVSPNPDLGNKAPTITLLPDGSVRISHEGIPGQLYQVQRSLELGNWQQLATLTAASDGSLTFTDTTPPPGKAFYRFSKL